MIENKSPFIKEPIILKQEHHSTMTKSYYNRIHERGITRQYDADTEAGK